MNRTKIYITSMFRRRKQILCVLAFGTAACLTLISLSQLKLNFSYKELLTPLVLSNKLKTMVLHNTEKLKAMTISNTGILNNTESERLKAMAFSNNENTGIAPKQSAQTQRKCEIKTESGATHGYINDFSKYPCVAGLTQDLCGRCVRTVNPLLVAYEKYHCVPLKIMTPTPICIYDAAQDQYVSGDIIKKGAFEHDLIFRLMTYLKEHSDYAFLDIGCNIGLYTLVAAKLSKRVVCVDPVLENTLRVATALKRGNIIENVTLIWNALYDKYVTIPLVFERRNVGGTALKQVQGKATDVGKSQYVNTVMLDDLTPLFKGKKIVIKIDVEQAELDVLKGGEEFFKNVDVRMVQMEVAWHRGKPSLKAIADIMVDRGFTPFNSIQSTTSSKLSSVDFGNWLPDVYFIKL